MNHARILPRMALIGAAGLWMTAQGCPEEGLRQIGATCYYDGQCGSGLCATETCLDPELDEDGDSLINRIEGALRTNALLADSDGDGLSDPAEIGDLSAPTDSDGDGRLDAIESLLADTDGDCLVDQEDPHDGLSDMESEMFPQACGDGSISCLANPLAGTCAARLGVALAECFHPAGSCYVQYASFAEMSATATWDNGSSLPWSSSGDVTVGQLLGPEGAVCANFRQVESDTVSTVNVDIPKGPAFVLRVGEQDLFIDVTCPGGEVLTVGDEVMQALETCSGLASEVSCELVHNNTCTTDAECGEGWSCCPLGSTPDSGSMCMPGSGCDFGP
ncbi:MAG: hypothetical protein EP329_07050 [Deltaproteobacteria bacterium]|nr:MAG: hypothetical protein EP329_07050 [Deltaproteobacteria bacterium]